MRLPLVLVIAFLSLAHATLPLWPIPRHVQSGNTTLWMTRDVKLSYSNDPNLQNFLGWLWESAQLPNLFVSAKSL